MPNDFPMFQVGGSTANQWIQAKIPHLVSDGLGCSGVEDGTGQSRVGDFSNWQAEVGTWLWQPSGPIENVMV